MAAEAKTKYFFSGPVNVPIGGDAEVVSKLSTKGRGKIKDIDVGIRFTHPDTTYLTIALFDKSSTGGPLFEFVPQGLGASPNLGTGSCEAGTVAYTILDQQAPLSIADPGVTNPFVGSFRPSFGIPRPEDEENALTFLKGQKLSRGYSLGVIDYSNPALVGAINCWYLKIRYKPEPKKKKKKKK